MHVRVERVEYVGHGYACSVCVGMTVLDTSCTFNSERKHAVIFPDPCHNPQQTHAIMALASLSIRVEDGLRW